MSLLLDALRQAEEKKKQTLEAKKESLSVSTSIDTVFLEEQQKPEPDPQPVKESSYEEDEFSIDDEILNAEELNLADPVLTSLSFDGEESADFKKVGGYVPASEVIEPATTEFANVRSGSKPVVSPNTEIPIVAEKKQEAENPIPAQADEGGKSPVLALDPSLNIFEVGKKPGASQKNIIVIWVTLFLALILTFFLFWFYQTLNETTSDTTNDLFFEEIEGDGNEGSLQSDPIASTEEKNPSEEEFEKDQRGLHDSATVKSTEFIRPEERTAVIQPQKKSHAVSTGGRDTSGTKKNSIIIKRRVLAKPLIDQIDIAYSALLKGDYTQSRSDYQNVLNEYPKQVDAMLGLAKLNTLEGRLNEALAMYENVLLIDVSNTTAKLGILHLSGQKGSMKKLAVLRDLSVKYPQNPQILSSLGNELAAQSKWVEAQEAYFQAYSIKPSSVEYVFNLAVSLDHLGKYRAAKQFYREVIQLNEATGNGLNVSQASQRLKQLGD